MIKQLTEQDVLRIVRQEAQTGGYAFHRHTGVDGSQLLSGNGSGLNGYQVFTSTGTFTPPAGFTKFFVRLQAGGGGGGSPNDVAASGGAAGGYAEKLCTITGATSVTIGGAGAGGSANSDGSSGGQTSFGSIFHATGGQGGGKTTANGVGGTGVGGDLNVVGGDGGIAMQVGATAYNISGYGGISYFGGGGISNVATGTSKVNGVNGEAYGSGGSGGTAGTTASGFPTGGNGVQGVCIISW